MSTVAAATPPMYGWDSIPWKKFQRSVFKLQKRIYQASLQGNRKSVRKLQRLLMSSRAAKLLAVRRVSQQNSGKKTPGVDGVKSLSKRHRLLMANRLSLTGSAKPVRRVWIDKTDSDEKRPLGIPVMEDRAGQTLVKEALEPEWEARFEPNSFGFRPDRSCHDAVEAVFNATGQKAKFVLDADIAKCFDRIDHRALLAKVNASPFVQRQIKAWFRSGVMDGEHLFPTLDGVMQGGPLSPLLANVALHGLESTIVKSFPRRKAVRSPIVVRYADDFVILNADRRVIEQCKEVAQAWLKPLGLELKPSKTRITHTLENVDGQAGFDFLGFNIRQHRTSRFRSGKTSHGTSLGFKTLIKPSSKAVVRHLESLRKLVHSLKSAAQEQLIYALNPVIRGWTRYYSTVVSKRAFDRLDHVLYQMLTAWAKRRHSKKSGGWRHRRYCRRNEKGVMTFQPSARTPQLYLHASTPIRRHVKVRGECSPFDGKWIYWSIRRGHSPEVPPRVTKLLRKQAGRCCQCRLYFQDGDSMDVVNKSLLLHQHCLKQWEADIAAPDSPQVRMTSVIKLWSRMRGNSHVRF
jgi:RNA-directed DNA polymerase